MKHVFLVAHVHELPHGEEEIKIIGIYETKAAGQLAVRRAKRREGFRDHPKGFSVAKYELGEDEWREGFVTVYYTEKRKKKTSNLKVPQRSRRGAALLCR